MSRALAEDVARAFDDANADPASRVIVSTSEGRGDCKDHRQPESEAEARDPRHRPGRQARRRRDSRLGRVRRIQMGAELRLRRLGRGRTRLLPRSGTWRLRDERVTMLLPAMVGLANAREM